MLFGVDWCAYCRSARDTLKRLGLEFRDIELQSPADIQNHPPAEVRRVLLSLTGSHTVPQIFVGGKSLGGATELVAAVHSGRLAEMLAPLGIQAESAA